MIVITSPVLHPVIRLSLTLNNLPIESFFKERTYNAELQQIQLTGIFRPEGQEVSGGWKGYLMKTVMTFNLFIPAQHYFSLLKKLLASVLVCGICAFDETRK